MYDKIFTECEYTVLREGGSMGLLEVFKTALALKNEDTMRVGLSGFKSSAKKVEDARAGIPSISNKDIKLSDLMRRTNIY